MTVKDIFDSALRILAESTVSGDNDDYEERAPYLIAAFCTEAQDADAMLRRATDEAEQEQFSPVFIPLDSEFPLLGRFACTAALYLAAMLVLDYDSELSDRLYDKYSDSMARLCETIPFVSEAIGDRYGFC